MINTISTVLLACVQELGDLFRKDGRDREREGEREREREAKLG